MTKKWQIAQLNLANAMYSPDDARISEFYARIDEINALAETSHGFVWRLQSDSGNATDILVNDDPMLIVNLSVWQSIDALADFAYKTAHRELLAKRRKWFVPPAAAHQVLWWVPAGHEPSVEEAMSRLAHLQETGPDSDAFTFRSRRPPPIR
jgi:hypothetical protein